ncbi:MAG: hypothetical protein COB59_11210 [Rhodospirillaceae bacterium]|nr:MAG: hypothetical protein COB59_11210 [Rhodospirillaceae bacterium]
MFYEWEWLKSDDARILYVKQIKKLDLTHWQTLLTDALSNFDGGQLKVIYDMTFGNTTIRHTDSLKLSEFTMNLGVDEIVFVSVINNNYNAEKAILFNASAKKAGNNVLFRHFKERQEAEKWLFEY